METLYIPSSVEEIEEGGEVEPKKVNDFKKIPPEIHFRLLEDKDFLEKFGILMHIITHLSLSDYKDNGGEISKNILKLKGFELKNEENSLEEIQAPSELDNAHLGCYYAYYICRYPTIEGMIQNIQTRELYKGVE